jgi:hypothetical protein
VIAAVRRELPGFMIETVDVDATLEALPDEVFSTPTYTLTDALSRLATPM